MRHPNLIAVLLLAVVSTTAAAAEGGIGELTILGTLTSGDYGGAVDSDTQSACLRFRVGNETRFFADLEARRTRSDREFFASPLGPIPTRRRGPTYGPGPGGGVTGATGPQPSGLAGATAESNELRAEDWVSGLADLRLGIGTRILGGGAKLFRLDAEAAVKAPIASADEDLGTGEVDYRLGISGSYRFWTVTGFGGIGWNVLGDPEWADLANVVDAFVGLETEPLRDAIIFSGWLEGNQEVVAGAGSRTALGLGIRATGKLRWQAQITAGLGGSAEDLSARAGVSFGVPTPALGSTRVR